MAVSLLAACDTGAQQSNPTIPQGKASSFHKDIIYFPDGSGLELSGKLRRYDLIENKFGNFDRYIFEFFDDIMAVEGAVFAVLVKSGYQRKVRREDDKLFDVTYIKKGFAPVSMTYERMPAKADVRAYTRLKVIWKDT